MSGMWGADVRALRALASGLRSGADALRTHRAQVAAVVEAATRWDGPDAAQFRSAWATTLGPSLTGTASLLDAAADRLATDADQQQSASADGGGARAELDQALRQAQQAIEDGQAALAEGDFAAYGEAQDRLQQALESALAAEQALDTESSAG